MVRVDLGSRAVAPRRCPLPVAVAARRGGKETAFRKGSRVV